MNIQQNLTILQQNIKTAQQNSAYAAPEVQVLAVSKTKPLALIKEAFDQGQLDFGENKVQEFVQKEQSLPRARWHFIGHLQTNKVRQIIGKTVLIHSLDRLELAKEIEKRSSAANVVTDCLIQLNLAREDSKSGLYAEDLMDFVAKLADYPHIRVLGLMAIGPNVSDEIAIRKVFRQLRELRDLLQAQNLPYLEMKWLSMGMSYDYQLAVEEGANIIRVGSGIFGERDYSLQEK